MNASLLTRFKYSDIEVLKSLRTIESRWSPTLRKRSDRGRDLPIYGKSRYILSMFPYPSGRLHLGHVRIYTSGDLLKRYNNLLINNKNQQFDHVIHPMGFDSFGLPAENAARERGLDPASWTNSNIKAMKAQLDDLSLQLDWKEATSNPSFYKWTQDLFLKLFDAGLAYKSLAHVNWDPVDMTVLADEQVDDQGRSWRSGATVERRYHRQWFVKTNAFTNDIYHAHDINITGWADILSIQKNWVGKPTGWLLYLKSDDSPSPDIIPVFTRQPELLFDCRTTLLVGNSHWINQTKCDGMELRNPFTSTILRITETSDDDKRLSPNGYATLDLVGTCNLTELDRSKAISKAKLMGMGAYVTSDKYRDWLVSRQRCWGTPIPTIFCDNCGHKAVEQSTLPVKLPNLNNLAQLNVASSEESQFSKVKQISSPLAKLAPKEWLHIDCPSCGAAAQRECDTLDTLFDSSWYFLRYATKSVHDKPFDADQVQPAWCYIGGKEHACMHLFYARFVTHFLHSIGDIRFREPFINLLVQGVVKGLTYKRDGKYIPKEEVDRHPDKSGLERVFEKMSKSKGNGVDPQELLDRYGVDATRFCLMAHANPRSERLWKSDKEEFGPVISFIRRIGMTVQEYKDIGDRLLKEPLKSNTKLMNENDAQSATQELNKSFNQAYADALFYVQEVYQFRQYISVMHNMLSTLRSHLDSSIVYTEDYANALASLIVMLNPIAPHLTEELWSQFSASLINPLRHKTSSKYNTSLLVCEQPWPLPDSNTLSRTKGASSSRSEKRSKRRAIAADTIVASTK